MKRGVLTLLFAAIILSLFAGLLCATEEDEQERVVGQFIRTYLLKNREIASMTPTEECNLFGRYPFTGPVQYAQPKVDEHQALVEFDAQVVDSKYPGHGAVLLRWYKGNWYVRQVLFYNKIPRIFGLPSRSKTDADRGAEPIVKQLSLMFINAWGRNDLKTMRQIWFNWPTLTKIKPENGLSMQINDISICKTAWNTYYAQYDVKATYKFGILSYSMTIRGGLPLVKENGVWKVIGNQMIYTF